MTENTVVEQVPYDYLTPTGVPPSTPSVMTPVVAVQPSPSSEYDYLTPEVAPQAAVEPSVVPVSDKRVDTLAKAREQKIERLGGRTGYGPQDRTDTSVLVGGYKEHMGNKILNDYSPYELEYLGQQLNNQYGVVETATGLMQQSPNGELVPYKGNPADLMSYYEYATRDGNIKRGTWGGRDPAGRYSAEYLNSKVGKDGKPEYIGEAGVDVTQLKRHYLLPSSIARTYEALQHGSSQTLPNRLARYNPNELAAYQEARDRIGSGATEAYRNVPIVRPENFNGDEFWANINDRFKFDSNSTTGETRDMVADAYRQAELAKEGVKNTYGKQGLSRETIANTYRKQLGEDEQVGTDTKNPDNFINRAGNTGAAFASSFTRGLVLDSGAAIGDLIGLDESTVGTSQSRRAYADELFGYDPGYSQKTMENVSKRVASMYDKKELDMGDLIDITTDVVSTPEILADSLGMIAGLAVGFGKFTKVGKAISGVEKEYRAGNLTKTEAKEAIKRINSTSSVVEKATKLAASNVGYGATVAGMTENAVEEFAKNNEGNVDGLDVLRIGAFSAAIASVDRFASKVALNDIPGIRSINMFSPESTRALRDVVSEMPADAYARTASSVAKVLGGSAKLVGVAGMEGLTEYSQTMAEIFSTKYATEKYGDEFGKLFEDRANQIEALTGAAVGVVMGGQMHSTNLAVQGVQGLLPNGKPQTAGGSTPSEESELSPEAQQELDDDHKTYAQTFNRLKNQLAGAQLSPATLSEHLSDLEELKRTRSAAEKKIAPEVLEQADGILTKIQEQVEAMVMRHPDGNLPLTRGTSTAVSEMEAVQNNPDNSLGSRPLSETEQKALAETAIDIIAARKGESITDEEVLKLNTFGNTNGVETARIERIIKSHASVESEATVEERGVLGRERALDLMLGSGTTSKSQVQKTYDEAATWLSTTLSSINQLEEGIREAEEKAATANNSARKGVAVKPVYTQYRKLGVGNKAPEYFDIAIKYDGNKYMADTTQALRLISDKKRTASNLNNLLNQYHQKAVDYLDPASTLTSGGYRVPENAKASKGVTSEVNYVKAVNKTLTSVESAGKVINRIILGEEPEARWSPQSVRSRQNSLRINITSKGGTYSSADVVYVHAGGSYNTKKKGETPFYNSELYKSKNPAGKEILAAIEAGATIVLDSQYRVDNSAEGVLLSRFMQAHGYIPVGAVNSDNPVEGNIFVPDNEVNARRLALSQEAASVAKATVKAKEARQQRLIDLAVEEAASNLPENTGRTTEAVQSDITAAMEAVREDFLPLAKKQVEESLKEGETLTEEAVAEQLTKNVRTFMKNRVASAVYDLRLALERDNETLDNVTVPTPGLKALVQDAIDSDAAVVAESRIIIDAWKQASALRLKGNELIGALNTALESIGKHVASERKDDRTVVLREVGTDVLETSAGATNDIKSYAVEYQVINLDGSVTTEVKHPVFNVNNYPVGKTTGNLEKGTVERTILNVNEVSHNPTDYLTVSRVTPLNTIPTDTLPEVFSRIGDSISTALKQVLAPLNKSELRIAAGVRDSENEAYVRDLMDSPARGLIYNEDGTINPTVAVAMGLALADLIKTDSFKLTLGAKDDKTLANMFRVSEAEVTAEMRKLAAEHGTLMKSVAHNLGSSTLKALGISKLKTNTVNRGQYERMVSDLGNYVIAAAEEVGVLKTTTEKSSVLAGVYHDSDLTDTGSLTTFVHLPAVKKLDKTSGVFTTSLNKATTRLNEDYALVVEMLPDPINNINEPRFGSPIPQEEQNEILSTVRNDAVGGNIPAEAKETLRSFMDTPYEMDLENTGEFLKELNNPTTKDGVLKSLGYVTISDSNPDYVKLTFEKKEIQEAINRDVEESIAQIRNYYEAIQNGLPNEMYFPFYYTSNHRYMMNSNTLNGQSDKLHRFFLYPKQHKVEYSVDRLNNTFIYNYVQDGESKSIDSSLYVRAALAQAMGIDIDKTTTNEIIRIGNELLSMTAADALAARASVLATGTFTLTNTTGATVYEPAHLSHGLQGLEFIHGYKSTTDSTFTNALSAEYDALTSGFSNKVQQFGTVSSRSEQLRRVGIVDPANPVAERLEDPSVGVNDMLSDKSLLDSYKNLAKDTILDLARQVKTLPPKAATLFDSIAVLLPGADQRNVAEGDVIISSELRSLFKPGFMIFNYSAGINRIVTNLGNEMVTQMFKTIAGADLNTLSAEQKTAFQAIADMVYVGTGKPLGITIAELQRRIRSESATALKTTIKEWNQGKREVKTGFRLLTDVLVEDIIKPTYGASVEESFTKNFSEFIEIQNVTNDAFKLSFAVFTQLLQQKVSQFRASSNNAPISDEQMLTFIGELREAFPVIAGPLSDQLADGVYVYSTDTRSLKGTLATTVSPVLKYADSRPTKSRKVNPLIRTLVAAANSGAVLPFHALDGAQMSRLTRSFVSAYLSKIEGTEKGAGLLPVHDAVVPPLPFSDVVGYLYNKNTVELNSQYSVIGEIQKMVERTQSILSGTDPELKLNGAKVPEVMTLSFISNKAIKENKEVIKSLSQALEALQTANADVDTVSDKRGELKAAKQTFSFNNSFNRIKSTVNLWNIKVEQERSTMYAEGTKVGVLVTTPGGVYPVGSKEVDLSYLENLHDLYETVSVNVAPVVEETKVSKTSGAPESLQARISISNAVFYAMPPQLRKLQEYVDSSAGMLLLKDLLIKPTSVITVVVNDKTVRSEDNVLSDAELHAVDLAWSQTVLVGNTALRKGATLVFSQEAVTTPDLGDSSIMGESYVFHRITESGDYTVTPEAVDGVTVYKVSKSAPEDTVTLIDDTQDVTIPELDKVTNKNGYKNIINRYKEQTKRCK